MPSIICSHWYHLHLVFGSMDLPTIVSPATPSALASLANNANAVGAAWMLSSAIFTTYSATTFLKYKGPESSEPRALTSSLSRPTLLTLYRFGGSLLLGLLAHPNFQIQQRIHDTLSDIPSFALPAAFLFVANYANSISLDRIGISLTYTSKCAIPLITVIMTLCLDGKRALPGRPTLLSLVPIALGIAAASWDSPTFETIGFAAAVISCTAQSALNVSSKHAMTRTGTVGPQAQRAMAAVGFAITFVFSGIQAMMNKPRDADSKRIDPPAWLTAMAVISYHLEYVLSFMFIKLVAPVAYGACDAMRRLSIIVSGHAMFGGHPFTPLNISGIAMALVGALAYSITSSGAGSKSGGLKR